jgi:hypothetical protein
LDAASGNSSPRLIPPPLAIKNIKTSPSKTNTSAPTMTTTTASAATTSGGTAGSTAATSAAANNPHVPRSSPHSARSSGASDGLTFFQHGADIDRQSTVIAQLDADAEKESKINAGMAAVMNVRLESGRAAAERVLSAVQAFASAEASYARAIKALGSIRLLGDADGPSLRGALAEFSTLPESLASVHARLSEALVPCIRSVRDIVQELRTACREVGQGAATAQKSVDAARRGLKAALMAHRDACKAFDAALIERQKIGSRSRGVESDPWVAEGRLVEQQASLQAAQTYQRRYLAGAFRRVGELERRRVTATCESLLTLTEVSSQVAAAAPDLAASCSRAAAALADIDVEGDLDAFTAVAGDSVRNGDALSARQTEMVDHLWRELLASAEIVRQGELQRFGPDISTGTASSTSNSGTREARAAAASSFGDGWKTGYGVLVRAGYLHWFSAGSNGKAIVPWGPTGGPVLSLNLARCAFEQGAASAWRVVEQSGGWLGGTTRATTLRAGDDETSMDWVADIREMITICSSK